MHKHGARLIGTVPRHPASRCQQEVNKSSFESAWDHGSVRFSLPLRRDDLLPLKFRNDPNYIKPVDLPDFAGELLAAEQAVRADVFLARRMGQGEDEVPWEQ